MRRLSALLLLVVISIASLTSVSAQEATPVSAPSTVHPLVGTWLADTDPENPDNAPALFVFFADGAYVEYDAEEGGDFAAGRWQATGDLTADLTLIFVGVTDEEFEGLFKVRATVDVAADGETFTGEYTGEFVGPDGTGSGEYGPGTVTATRISVEPMGATVGTFEDLFGSDEEDEGADEGTPGA